MTPEEQQINERVQEMYAEALIVIDLLKEGITESDLKPLHDKIDEILSESSGNLGVCCLTLVSLLARNILYLCDGAIVTPQVMCMAVSHMITELVRVTVASGVQVERVPQQQDMH